MIGSFGWQRARSVALKDLVADHRRIAEEAIEKIVAPYVRYDAAALKIVWTPQARLLSSDARVLVFLVAVLGWQYVADENRDVATKPSDLEGELGIAGGTLRPILKKLKDSHLIAAMNGHYRVQLANLESIEVAIAGEMPKGGKEGQARKSAKIKGMVDDEKFGPVRRAKKTGRGSSGQLKAFLTKWTSDGFFREPKTLANLLERYHEHGIITKQTSLSGLMLEAVREGLLARTKIEDRGKQVWAYRAQS